MERKRKAKTKGVVNQMSLVEDVKELELTRIKDSTEAGDVAQW